MEKSREIIKLLIVCSPWVRNELIFACVVLNLDFFFFLPFFHPVISLSILLFHILLDFVGLALLIAY